MRACWVVLALACSSPAPKPHGPPPSPDAAPAPAPRACLTAAGCIEKLRLEEAARGLEPPRGDEPRLAMEPATRLLAEDLVAVARAPATSSDDATTLLFGAARLYARHIDHDRAIPLFEEVIARDGDGLVGRQAAELLDYERIRAKKDRPR